MFTLTIFILSFVIYLNNYLYLYTYKERVQSSFDSLVNKVFVKISL